MFVVSQVDGEGYVLSDAFVNAVSSLYTEDSLKALVKELAPECITEANARAKGKYRLYRFISNYTARNYGPSYIEILEHVATYCSIQTTDNI